MIGGTDIIIPAVGDAAALETCTRLVKQHWPAVRFEDALTGEKYSRPGDIPLDRVRELFAYRDTLAEAAWDADSPDSPPNSMLYLIFSPEFITAVLDDPDAAEMKPLLESLREALLDRVLTPGMKE